MKTAKIKLESELRDGKLYYKLMIKPDSFLSVWSEEFGSFDKKEVDSAFNKVKGARNIRIEDE